MKFLSFLVLLLVLFSTSNPVCSHTKEAVVEFITNISVAADSNVHFVDANSNYDNVTPPPPGVVSPVTFCQGATSTALTASAAPGGTLNWYSTSAGGTSIPSAPTPSTSATGTVFYYVSQTVDGQESARAQIIVDIKARPAAPGVSAPIDYCVGFPAIPLTANGTSLLWYTSATGGTGSPTAPTPSTSVAGAMFYFVSQTVNGCEGPRAQITVLVKPKPMEPSVITPINYCVDSPASPLTATGSFLRWYADSTGGTGSISAPTPQLLRPALRPTTSPKQ